MTLDTSKIISRCETLYTLSKRVKVSDDRDTRREQIVAEFEAMCTDAGKIAARYMPTDWTMVSTYVDMLHTVASQTDELRCGTFRHGGGETALLGSFVALSHVLGFHIEDAATASDADPIVDDAAMIAVEGAEPMKAAE